MSMKKIYGLLLMLTMCFVVSGCFSGNGTMTIGENGSVDYEYIFVGDKEVFGNEVEKQGEMLRDKLNSSAKVEPYKNGSMSGYKLSAHYPSIGEYARNLTSEYNKDWQVKRVKGWFFDAYSFDFPFRYEQHFKHIDPRLEGLTQAMVATGEMEIKFNLPYAADSSNADNVTNNNKTLTWDLAEAFSVGADKDIQVKFKIWHKSHVIITAIVIGVLILISIILGIMSFTLDGSGRIAAAIFSVLLFFGALALGGISLYMISSTPNFNDNTIITKATQKKDEKASKTNAKSAEPPPVTPAPSTGGTSKTSGPLNGMDLSLGNITIGDTTEKVRSVMGSPGRIVTENGQVHWKYNDIDVIVYENRVSEIISSTSAASTPRGFHEGSRISDVWQTYGNNYRHEKYGNLDLYEYPITSNDGVPCLLRFAVRQGENTVNYVSMRKL